MGSGRFSFDESSVLCSICLETVTDCRNPSCVKLQCGHEFHLDCICSAFNAKGRMQCPNCRNIENGQWLYANNDPQPPSESSTASASALALDSILASDSMSDFFRTLSVSSAREVCQSCRKLRFPQRLREDRRFPLPFEPIEPLSVRNSLALRSTCIELDHMCQCIDPNPPLPIPQRIRDKYIRTVDTRRSENSISSTSRRSSSADTEGQSRAGSSVDLFVLSDGRSNGLRGLYPLWPSPLSDNPYSSAGNFQDAENPSGNRFYPWEQDIFSPFPLDPVDRELSW